MICFNPGPLVIWCFANCTTLTHSSFRKRFHFAVTICQKPFTEMFLQMVGVPGPEFEYAPLSRLLLFHRDFKNTPAGKLIIIHDSYS